MMNSRLGFAALVAIIAWYSGVDVVPGTFDEAKASAVQPETDFTLRDFLEGPDKVIRLVKSDGRAISEAEERKLLPIIESLESQFTVLESGVLQAIEDCTYPKVVPCAVPAGEGSNAAKLLTPTLRSLKSQVKKDTAALLDLGIFNKQEVNAIKTRADVVHLVEQMGATVTWDRHLFRLAIIAMMIACPNSVGEGPIAAVAIELFLIFLPYGHPVTTAGRHFEGTGQKTWFGLRRFDLGLFHLMHIGLLYTAQQVGTLIKDKKIFNGLGNLVSALSAVFFAYAAYFLYTSGAHPFENSEEECAPEFNIAVAAAMHKIYLSFFAWDCVRSVLATLAADLFHSSPWLAYGQSPSNRWFWFLVLYFSPLEDSATPMVMACVRQSLADVHKLLGREDTLLGPATTFVELLHWFVTVSSGCHWPIVLWLRIPLLLEGAVTFALNLKHALHVEKGAWVKKTAEKTEVKVYIPDSNGRSLSSEFVKSGPQSSGIPGLWTEVSTTLLMDQQPMSLGSNPKGAMRDVYHCQDTGGKAAAALSAAWPMGGLHKLDKDRLVFKKYRDSTGPVGHEIYFRDVYMQKVAADLSDKFSNAVNGTADIRYAPACVLQTKDKQLYGCEFFLSGKYQKWNNNGMFPEAIMTTDSTPTAFCHYSHQITYGSQLVCDIQGTEGNHEIAPSSRNLGQQFILTDPQIHTNTSSVNERINGSFGLGDLGPDGIKQFFQGHRCGPLCKKLGLHHELSDYDQNSIDKQIKSQFEKGGRKYAKYTLIVVAVWMVISVWSHVYSLSEKSPDL